jgi:hypothetical protein
MAPQRQVPAVAIPERTEIISVTPNISIKYDVSEKAPMLI